jgi:hypothetical protein
LGQLHTVELLEEAGLDSKVIDFGFFHFSPIFYENIEQIRRVEQLSDAYHLIFGEDEVMVMYLLEVTHRVQPGAMPVAEDPEESSRARLNTDNEKPDG